LPVRLVLRPSRVLFSTIQPITNRRSSVCDLYYKRELLDQEGAKADARSARIGPFLSESVFLNAQTYIPIYTRVMFIEEVVKALRAVRVRFAVAGGYAVTLHGAVRGTVDLDLVLSLERNQFVAAEKALCKLGLVARLPVSAAQVFDFREEYIANRNLIAWSFYAPDDPTKLVDILITHDVRELQVVQVRLGTMILPVVGLEALIDMKRAAGRAQDLEDVRALEKLR